MPAYLENPTCQTLKEDRIQYVNPLPASIHLDIEDQTVERKLHVRNTATAALNNLETVLRLVEGGKLKVGAKTGRPTPAAQKNLRKLLQEGDWYEEEEILQGIGHIQAFAWPMLLQGAGLAEVDGSALKLNYKGKKAIEGNLPKVIKGIWDGWRTTRFLDEFSRVDRIKGQKALRGRVLIAAHTRRPALYEGLSLCAPGKWLTVKELIRSMYSAGLEFEVAHYGCELYVGDAQCGHLDEFGDQAMVKTRYMLAFLFEYAATLGIMDVAYIHPEGALSDYRSLWGMDGSAFLSRYDGLMYIRINALGAFALEMTDAYEAAPTETRAVLTVPKNHDPDDVKNRSTGFEYAGRTHLISCKDAMLQKLAASDRKLSKMCLPAGEKHLVILPGKEKQFIRTFAELGYIVPQLRDQI